MNTDGQRRALRDVEPPIDDEIALAMQEFERLFRSEDYVEPVFLRPYLIEGLGRIARAGTPRDVGYREIHELLPCCLL